jgi:ABC-type transport system substrate-binding protein
LGRAEARLTRAEAPAPSYTGGTSVRIYELRHRGDAEQGGQPFSGFMKERWLPGHLQEVIDKYDRDKRDLSLVEQHMTSAGYAKDDSGVWAKDGATLKVPVRGPQFFAPLAPPLAEQLKSAGFDATAIVEPDSSTAWNDDMAAHRSSPSRLSSSACSCCLLGSIGSQIPN